MQGAATPRATARCGARGQTAVVIIFGVLGGDVCWMSSSVRGRGTAQRTVPLLPAAAGRAGQAPWCVRRRSVVGKRARRSRVCGCNSWRVLAILQKKKKKAEKLAVYCPDQNAQAGGSDWAARAHRSPANIWVRGRSPRKKRKKGREAGPDATGETDEQLSPRWRYLQQKIEKKSSPCRGGHGPGRRSTSRQSLRHAPADTIITDMGGPLRT